MEVVLAKSSGFCFGVKRAVDRVYEQLAENKKIYTYGPIVHNDDVVADLEEKGCKGTQYERGTDRTYRREAL